ncbi:peptidoglycan DD-metalloendopeptidase family protein [Bacillus lacus]|uniref:Peptidoglycan DD-metalloendopeptidase family protein n=1 Tax=Metabacillus lacus TaxID=1983721 RepID=A0A7X2IWH6_9BACI|nr:M23 family metallopeptidase [Metabacillus lacus]MRX71040.1 peptidoglycan DD-metalloendopeptidase family protein [Metabacillus lacus]
MRVLQYSFALIFLLLSLLYSIEIKRIAAAEHKENDWVLPVNGYISDTFGTRAGKHKGIDIAASKGEKVFSVSKGIVSKSYYSQTYGNVIFVMHENGYETVYAHLNERLAREGEKVSGGQVIGTVGNTGVSRGNHLHFEVHRGNWTPAKEHAIDPFIVLSEEKMQSAVTVSAHSDLQSVDSAVFVKKGDTLWSISKKLGVGSEELKSWNHLSHDRIYPGQKLLISKPCVKHIVARGESLSSIAQHYEKSLSELIELNELKDDKIFPDQILLLEK